MSTEYKQVPLGEIVVPDRLRKVNDDQVMAIQASIDAHGLLNPITVRATPAAKGGKFTLVAGAHRLRAMALLKEDTISALVVDADKEEAILIEVEENLFRNELSALERAIVVQSYRDVFEKKHGKIARGGDKKSKGQLAPLVRHNLTDLVAEEAANGFSAYAAERLGLSHDAIKRAYRIARSLIPALRECLHGRPEADNQSFLLKVAGWEPSRQTALARWIGDGKDPSQFMQADTQPEAPAEQKAFGAILRNWRGLPGNTRWQVLTELEILDILTDEQKAVLAERFGTVPEELIA